MNSARIRQIIKEELYKVLKEDNPDVSTGEMTDDERTQAKYDAERQYRDNAIKNIMTTWLQQLTPVKYRQLYEDLDKMRDVRTGASVWTYTKQLIDKWGKEGNNFNDVRMMTNVYLFSEADEELRKIFSRSGLVYRGYKL